MSTEKEVHRSERVHIGKKEFWRSPKGQKTAFIVLAIIVALLVFQAGVAVGYRKARFSYSAGERFMRVWGERREGGFPDMGRFMGGHGAAGKVVSVTLPSLLVATPDNVEKEVLLGPDTVIRRFRDTATSTDIQAGDFVVALGEPNGDGAIQAKFVRVMPPPPDGFNGPSFNK